MADKELCEQAHDAYNAFVELVVPDFAENRHLPLRKLAGPFLDEKGPLGHSITHMADYQALYNFMPNLDVPPATFEYIKSECVKLYQAGIALGRIYEMGREGRTISEEERVLMVEPDEDKHGSV